MRISKKQLRQIIREERKRFLNENRAISPQIIEAAKNLGDAINRHGKIDAFDIIMDIKNSGISPEIVDAIVGAFKSAQDSRDISYAHDYPQDSGYNYMTNWEELGL